MLDEFFAGHFSTPMLCLEPLQTSMISLQFKSLQKLKDKLLLPKVYDIYKNSVYVSIILFLEDLLGPMRYNLMNKEHIIRFRDRLPEKANQSVISAYKNEITVGFYSSVNIES